MGNADILQISRDAHPERLLEDVDEVVFAKIVSQQTWNGAVSTNLLLLIISCSKSKLQ